MRGQETDYEISGPMRGQETDHVISGPMRGLGKKLHPMAQTNKQTHRQIDEHGDSMTESAQLGRFSENSYFASLGLKSCKQWPQYFVQLYISDGLQDIQVFIIKK